MSLAYDFEPSGATGSNATVNVTCNWALGTTASTPIVVLAERASDGAQMALTSTGSNPPGSGAYYRDTGSSQVVCGNPWSGSTATFYVFRLTSPTQEFDPRNNSSVNVRALAAQLDRSVAAVQELSAAVFGKASADYPGLVLTSFDPFRLPGKTTRAGKFLRFDAQGDPEFDDAALSDSMLAELAALDELGAGIVKKVTDASYMALDSSTQGELILNLESAEGIKAVALNGTGISQLDVGALGIFLLAAEEAAAAQELLDLVPGTDVQPYDADLLALANLSTNGTPQRLGSGNWNTYSVTDFAKTILDDGDAAAARATLVLGTLAVENAASVGVDIFPDTDILRGLGSSSKQWAAVHALSFEGQDMELTGTVEAPLVATDFLQVNNAGALVLGTGVAITSDGSTADSNKTSLEFEDPTGTRTITFPDASGTVALVGGSGVGDLVGPASATDNAVARFDGTTGKVLQNSGVTINDSGNMTIGGNLTVNGTLNGTLNLFATLQDATPLVFEGATVNSFKTRLNIEDPTATRDIVLPDADGTVVLTESSPTLGDVTATGTLSAAIVSTTGAVNAGTSVGIGTSEAQTGSLALRNQTTAYSSTLRASNIASSNKTHELPNASGTLAAFSTLPGADNRFLISSGTAGDMEATSYLAQDASSVNLVAGLPFVGVDGSATAPTWSFANSTGAGMYRIGANQIGFATSATLRMRLDDNGLWLFKGIYAVAGSASFPGMSFYSDTDTGWYSAGSDQIAAACGGSQKFLLTSTGINNTAIGATTRSTGSFTVLKGRRPLALITGSGTLPAADWAVYRVTSAAAPLTLPTSPSDGDVVTIIVSHSTPSGTQILPDAGVLVIHPTVGTADGDSPSWLFTTTVGGTLAMVYDSSDGAWLVIESIGTWGIDA